MVPKRKVRVHKRRGGEAVQLCFANSVDCKFYDSDDVNDTAAELRQKTRPIPL